MAATGRIRNRIDYERTEREQKVIDDFLREQFGEIETDTDLLQEEQELIREILSFVEENYDTAAYYLGLPIDFTLLANVVR
ncbi:MAG: hypothetical protein BRC56_01670, partial [Cyanobacteria bacterium SW_9_47_5]